MKIMMNKSLKEYSFIGVGGVANILHLEQEDDLYLLPEILKNHDFRIIGRTSKIIFPDSDFSGYLLRFVGKNYVLKDHQLTAESGVSLSFISRLMVQKGYRGFASLVGIPGDLGGALANNAGCFGEEISHYLTEMTIYSLPDNKILQISKEQGQFAYRQSIFKKKDKWLIIAAKFNLISSKRETEEKLMKEAIFLRKMHQPSGIKTLGSTFKNPRGYSAGKLLEECCGKALAGENVRLNQKHTNFIEILNGATAENILSFIDILYLKVYNEKEISLEKEVIIFRW